ncbi:uncharacterized protein LOC108676205 [Hyalella azteca]|uniref:Uncharacterized protein LOC108676205 n=1 Tax=Hyalella azteca TaxID=294128 RepID=A0A8B7P154_HYAAZ|nr:uncharacterized protein LOC108676205 [Hyalella azteca]
MLSYATLVLDQSIDCGTSASFSLNKSQTVAACKQSNALPSLAPLLDHDYTKNVSSSLNFSSGLSCLSNTANIFDLTSDTSVMRQESECDHMNTAGPSTVPQDITSSYQSIGTNELLHSTHEHDTVRVIEEISADTAQSYGNSFDLNLSNLDQEASPYLSSINLNEYNAIAPLSSVCTIVKDRTDPCQSSPCILTHTMPMKKIRNTFRYEKDSLHSVFLNAARNKSLCGVIDVTDTEDSCSDSVGTNETFNGLSLGDSLLEDGGLRAEFSIHSSSNSNERPCGLFEHDFPLSYDNDLMDLNELLDRCLHDTNITEHTDEALNSFASPICPNSDLASQCSRAVVNTSERTSLSVYPDNHPRERKFSLDVASSQGNIPAAQDRRSEPLTCASNDMQGELC